MLRLDLSEIIRTSGMRQVYEILEQPYTDEDVEYVAPVTARLAITNTGSMLLVRGPFHTVIGLECSRCLGDVREPIDVEIEEEFDIKVVEDARHHDQVLAVVEDEVCRVFDGKVMQLDVLFRQAALLNAPLQPLCRPNCPGIPIKSSDDESVASGLQSSPFQNLAHYFDEGVEKP